MVDILGYEGRYAVTEDGEIFSYYKKDYLKQQTSQNGYKKVSFKKDGERQIFYVHRLVAQAFVPNPEGLPEVNHLDENKTNNHYLNLEWCTHKDNVNYGTSRQRAGEKQKKTHPFMKKVQCLETKTIYFSMQEASRVTGIDNTSISKACNGKRKTAGGFHWQFVD